jgi:hypothetical protein
MRRQAAETGRRGGKVGNRDGKRRGGLVAWHTKTPEQQQAVRAMLAAAGGKQTNSSSRAKAAQQARARAAMARPLSRAKAAFLADAGILKSVPLPNGVNTVAEVLAAAPPARADFPTREAWLTAMRAWAHGRNVAA